MAAASSDVLQTNAPTVTEAIQNIPPELRKIIFKHYLAIKLRQRAALGWDKVHEQIPKLHLTLKLRQRVALGWDEVHEAIEQIIKVLFCYKCDDCWKSGLCNMCNNSGVKHYLGYPVFDENDYDEIFKKFY